MLLYIATRIWDERDANKALELINKIYDLWWDINSLLHGKEIAERVVSGNAAPGDVKAWQWVYKSMTPQQIDERIRQEYKELQDAENQLRQILSKYGFSQQEVDRVIQSVKASIPYKHPNAGQVLGQQQSQQVLQQSSTATQLVALSTQQQQGKQAQQSQEALSSAGVVYVSQEQVEQRREQPRVVATGLRQAIVLPKNAKRVAIPA